MIGFSISMKVQLFLNTYLTMLDTNLLSTKKVHSIGGWPLIGHVFKTINDSGMITNVDHREATSINLNSSSAAIGQTRGERPIP